MPNPSTEHSHHLVLQAIQVTWTKASRGMPQAARRNQVPQTLELPESSGSGPLWLHQVQARESRNFALEPESRLLDRIPVNWEHGIVFKPDDEKLQVSFRYSQSQHGLPRRAPERLPLFHLSPGQTAQFAINGRFVSERGQFYRSLTLNLAWRRPFDTGLFLNRKPDRRVDYCAHLF